MGYSTDLCILRVTGVLTRKRPYFIATEGPIYIRSPALLNHQALFAAAA